MLTPVVPPIKLKLRKGKRSDDTPSPELGKQSNIMDEDDDKLVIEERRRGDNEESPEPAPKKKKTDGHSSKHEAKEGKSKGRRKALSDSENWPNEVDSSSNDRNQQDDSNSRKRPSAQFSDTTSDEADSEVLNATQTICDLLAIMGTVTDAQRKSILRSLKRIIERVRIAEIFHNDLNLNAIDDSITSTRVEHEKVTVKDEPNNEETVRAEGPIKVEDLDMSNRQATDHRRYHSPSVVLSSTGLSMQAAKAKAKENRKEAKEARSPSQGQNVIGISPASIAMFHNRDSESSTSSTSVVGPSTSTTRRTDPTTSALTPIVLPVGSTATSMVSFPTMATSSGNVVFTNGGQIIFPFKMPQKQASASSPTTDKSGSHGSTSSDAKVPALQAVPPIVTPFGQNELMRQQQIMQQMQRLAQGPRTSAAPTTQPAVMAQSSQNSTTSAKLSQSSVIPATYITTPQHAAATNPQLQMMYQQNQQLLLKQHQQQMVALHQQQNQQQKELQSQKLAEQSKQQRNAQQKKEILDRIHQMYGGKATEEQIQTHINGPYLVVHENGKVIYQENPFYPPVQPSTSASPQPGQAAAQQKAAQQQQQQQLQQQNNALQQQLLRAQQVQFATMPNQMQLPTTMMASPMISPSGMQQQAIAVPQQMQNYGMVLAPSGLVNMQLFQQQMEQAATQQRSGSAQSKGEADTVVALMSKGDQIASPQAELPLSDNFYNSRSSQATPAYGLPVMLLPADYNNEGSNPPGEPAKINLFEFKHPYFRASGERDTLDSEAKISMTKAKSSNYIISDVSDRDCNEWSAISMQLPTCLHMKCDCFKTPKRSDSTF